MPLFRIEETTSQYDVYEVEAESREEAERKHLAGESGFVSYDLGNDVERRIEEVK